jgi:hypothetical protein
MVQAPFRCLDFDLKGNRLINLFRSFGREVGDQPSGEGKN